MILHQKYSHNNLLSQGWIDIWNLKTIEDCHVSLFGQRSGGEGTGSEEGAVVPGPASAVPVSPGGAHGRLIQEQGPAWQ